MDGDAVFQKTQLLQLLRVLQRPGGQRGKALQGAHAKGVQPDVQHRTHAGSRAFPVVRDEAAGEIQRPAKGIITLRNPSDEAQVLSVDPASAFELPVGAPTRYGVRRIHGTSEQPSVANAGKPMVFTLKPFEVVVLECTP